MKKRIFLKRVLLVFLGITILLLPVVVFGAKDFEAAFSQRISQRWTGDFDGMVKAQYIRVLVPYSKTFYFIDKGTQRGAIYELVREFEKKTNHELKTRHLKFHAVFIPTSRDRLIPGLVEGLGDIAAGNLTITDERSKQIDFCDPFGKGISEILVTGLDVPPVKEFLEIAGKTIHVRKSSSYYESLVRANKRLGAVGKSKIKIIEANENLEDEDLLEMLNAGLIPMMVIDSHKGEFWAKIFENIRLHPELKLRENVRIAWAIRKNSPKLKKRINHFVKANKKGTLMGNMLFNRYLKDTKYINNNLVKEEIKRFQEAIYFFQKYGKRYDFDILMLAALAYQESRIDQNKRSHAGAVGVMQILPATAKDKNVNILKIEEIGPNIHAGTKYLRFIADRYFNDPGVDPANRILLTFAAYNAGPAKIAKFRAEAKSLNLDPNIWFKNVEIIAAKRIGRETVEYVSNIFKYYIAYSHAWNQEKAKKKYKNTEIIELHKEKSS